MQHGRIERDTGEGLEKIERAFPSHPVADGQECDGSSLPQIRWFGRRRAGVAAGRNDTNPIDGQTVDLDELVGQRLARHEEQPAPSVQRLVDVVLHAPADAAPVDTARRLVQHRGERRGG